MNRWFSLLALIAVPAIAHADEERPFCASRPGMGTTACTMAPGTVMVELGLGDWTGDTTDGTRTDSIATGETLVRVGLTGHLEAQVGWDGWSHQRQRDPSGTVSTLSGGGDALVGLKYNLANPDGSHVSVALQPFVTVPTGRAGIGAGDWGAGLTVPVSIALDDKTSLGLTPQVLAAVNASGDGRHLSYGAVVGLGRQIGESVNVTGEIGWSRDEDPSGSSDATLAGVSAGWMIAANTQLDAGANVRIGGTAPDDEVYFGISRRF